MKHVPILAVFAIFLLLGATANASAITQATESQNVSSRELRGAYYGVLAYDKMPAGFVCNTAPQVTYGVIKRSEPIFYDKNADYMFIRAGNAGAENPWQLQLGILKNDLIYDVSLKSRDRVLFGGMYSPDSSTAYSNFGIVLEPQESPTESRYQLANYDEFLNDLGDDNYLPIGLPFSQSYTLEAVVFDSNGDWITSDKCAKKVEVTVSVSDDGVLKVGAVRITDVVVSDVTKELPPLIQYGMGVTKIKCKPGLVLAIKASDNKPACLTKETRLKLMDMGWAKSESAEIKKTGMLSGKVTIGPLCPVEPCSSATNPYLTRNLILQSAESGPIFVSLNDDGSFSTSLEQDSYVVNLSKCSFIGCSSKLPTAVYVKAGTTVTLDLDIDTGIR